MAGPIQTQLRKVEEKLKPYLHDGPFASYWGLLEQKVKVKREHVAFGISLSLLFFYHLIIIFGANRFTWFACRLFGFWLG
jgi:hypothetical protein